MDRALEEVRRSSDGELEGFIRPCDDGVEALTVFHGLLSTENSKADAIATVHRRGLASLAERWYWRPRASGGWAVVLVQEVHPGRARVSVGYYALSESPVAVITSEDLAEGDVLTLMRPEGAIEGMPE